MDNGGEFLNNKFEKHCQDHGIMIMTLVAYTPEKTGSAERRNQVIIKGARTMLKDSELGRGLWSEVISTHVYI